MKLFFAQLEENREPYIDLFGEVCDEVIAWLMFLSAKRFITQEKYTVQDALDLMSDLPGVPVDFGGGIQGPARDVEAIRSYFTKPKWSKPAGGNVPVLRASPEQPQRADALSENGPTHERGTESSE